MQFYLASNQEKSGPFTGYQVREKLLQKEFTPEDLGWHDGLEKWIPVKEIPALQTVLKGLDDDRIRNEEIAPATPGSGEPAAPAFRCSQIRPVVRFLARGMDIALFTALIALFIDNYDFPDPPTTAEEADVAYAQIWRLTWINAGILFAWNFVEAFLLSTYGATLGKALLCIQVRNADGSRLSYRSALLRSFHVWLSGQAMGIPVLIYLVKLFAYYRLTHEGITSWDKAQDLLVRHDVIGDRRIFAALGVFLAIALLLNLSGSV